jgi:hypothetical protein
LGKPVIRRPKPPPTPRGEPCEAPFGRQQIGGGGSDRRNVIVAKAAFVAAVEQRAGKRVRLTRGARVHGDSGGK